MKKIKCFALREEYNTPEIVKKHGLRKYLAYIYSERRLAELVTDNGWVLEYVKDQTNQICLEAVKQNGLTLQFVKNQTEQMCLEAVKENGYVLIYVKNQTEQICLEAVKENGYALEYVNDTFKEEVKRRLNL